MEGQGIGCEGRVDGRDALGKAVSSGVEPRSVAEPYILRIGRWIWSPWIQQQSDKKQKSLKTSSREEEGKSQGNNKLRETSGSNIIGFNAAGLEISYSSHRWGLRALNLTGICRV